MAVAWVEVPLTRGKVTLVDLCDLEWVMRRRWHAVCNGKLWYAVTCVRLSTGRESVRRLHALLTGFKVVDHANGNGLDNRRANLRDATVQQNRANSRRPVGATNPFKGVYLRKDIGRWYAQIKVDGKGRHLGYFSDPTDAAQAYDDSARRYFGEFAALNFPRSGERACDRGVS